MVLSEPADDAQRQAREQADALAAEGRRVLLLVRAATALHPPESGDARLPADLTPAALVVLAERVRDDAAQTLHYFTEQGVALKVISGDNPRTVGAVAAQVGVPGVQGADDAIDARELPDDLDALADVLEEHSVFGRVTPHQKRAVVAALQRRGHVVAMTGDGVNDALALKDADIGVAMGNGSPATRAVAQLVLLDGRFAHLPDVVAEGRRVIANIERAANLFLVKNIYSLVLALITAVTVGAYPLAPIQLTLISAVTIGMPGFVLALGPNRRRYVPGFLWRVLRFAIPTGLVTGAAAYVGYRATRLIESGADVADGRTTATLIVLIVLAVDAARTGPSARRLEAGAGRRHGGRGHVGRARTAVGARRVLAECHAVAADRRWCHRRRRGDARRNLLSRGGAGCAADGARAGAVGRAR